MKNQSILFVCLGNICRSPMAEAIMKKHIENAGLTNIISIDSAGTIDFHEGRPSDVRMKQHASQRGYDLTHLSRPVRTSDFENFELILAMDDSNISNLMAMAPSPEDQQKIKRMTYYCTQHTIDHVPDPYHGGAEGFDFVIDILEDACEGLMKSLK